MVQSASVEDNMAEHQQPVPLEAIIPADTEAETQRSVPLPPPIMPETEDFSPGSVSDASSGYVSTSISMATLSDVYTLSWDLPPAFEAAPDEEDEGKPETEERSPDQSKAWKLLGLPEEERTEQDETNQTPPVRLEEQQEPDPGLGDQTEGNVDSGSGSEPAGEDDHAESQQRASAQVDHMPEEEAGAQAPPEPEGGHHPVKPPPQDPPGSDRTPDPTPEPNGDSALHISPNKPALSESPAPLSGSARPPSPVTDQARPAAPPRTSSSAAAAANPFKIQKVKTSDLKSFQRIVGEEGGDAAKVDRAGSVGAGLNLPAPAEGLEMMSDSEEGDDVASAVLPDWLKEGEFVTVGANKSGTVRYVGPTDFAAGTWVGVELEVPAGKNDGSVGGKHYFHCNPGYGVLVRPDRVARGGGATKRRRQQQKRRSANLSGSSPNLAALTALAKGEAGAASRHKGENRKSWNT